LIDKPGGLVRGDPPASESTPSASEQRSGRSLEIRNLYMEDVSRAAVRLDTRDVDVNIDGMVVKGAAAGIMRSEQHKIPSRLRVRNVYYDGLPPTKRGDSEREG
jgi:hypothetical protein